jgi:hypothetical protein
MIEQTVLDIVQLEISQHLGAILVLPTEIEGFNTSNPAAKPCDH